MVEPTTITLEALDTVASEVRTWFEGKEADQFDAFWTLFLQGLQSHLNEANQPGQYLYTVHCFTDKAKRRHFSYLDQATAYANQLLKEGEKCKLYPYREQRSYVDVVAERGYEG